MIDSLSVTTNSGDSAVYSVDGYLYTYISGAAVNSEQLGEGETAPTRTSGTDTETSFDVVTINKATRTIYCTRVGAGSDREISY